MYDWRGVWARDEQKLPSMERQWSQWVILAGRGFGKTRCGAESIREVVQRNLADRIALIAPTAADCRDVMLQGESGILNVFPPEERPFYQSSLRKVTFQNGAIATLYSAEEPERLRGPQHAWAWCLVGETPVLMADGTEKPLRDVRVGDFVQTRCGARRVSWQGLTRRNSEVFRLVTVDGRGIIGTSDHPVWIKGRGFIPLADVRVGMSVCVNNASNGAATRGTATELKHTGAESYVCTEQFGNLFTGQSPKDSIFTTLTVILRIIGSRIWNCFPTVSTAGSTCRTRFLRRCARLAPSGPWLRWIGSARRIWRKSASVFSVERATLVQPFIHALTVPCGVSMPFDGADFKASSDCALNAASDLMRERVANCTARRNATLAPLQIDPPAYSSGKLSASSAEYSSPVSGTMRDSAIGTVRLGSIQERKCAALEKLETCADVYDIAVEGEREFFANGILVHNCDEAAVYPEPQLLWDNLTFGLRLGASPRTIVTTTPKPTAFLRWLVADSGTILSRGSTYANAANLPANVLARFKAVYGGTAIGRQELEGQLLDEATGALWKRAEIEAGRVRHHPDLVRIVVAIDPSTTSTATSDECGIIAAGLGVDGHGYVLKDGSCRLPPAQWAHRAVSIFDAVGADRIIAEVNNGGDLVESVIRTERKAIPYKKVTASRGKVTRAEPVAALYEQRRIHHVGGFTELEDEQCNFVPGELAKSPNRADALVWAFTELMLKPEVEGAFY